MNYIPEPFRDDADTEIGKPTKEAYEKAKSDYKMFCSWLVKSRERKNELIDALAIERENEKTYLDLAEKNKSIIQRYEIYEEIERSKKKK